MILVKLFLSLSCVSAAFVSTASRSLAAEFSRKRGNQNCAELAEFQMPMSLPKMPSFPNLLPIAHCDNLPENSGSNNFLNTVIRSISNTIGSNQVFNWKEYEIMLYSKNYAGISEAFKRGAIDFSYIPKTKDFYEVLCNRECVEGNAIMKQYFDSGIFADMVEVGLITYEEMIDSAIDFGNYFVANMVLDHLIAKNRPEILSPDYKSKYGPVNNLHVLISHPVYRHKDWPSSDIKKSYYCNKYYWYTEEDFKFFRKYYLIFEEPSNDRWISKLRKRNVEIRFYNCDL